MREIPEFSELEVKLHMTLDSLSNGKGVKVKDEWIEQAGEEFKAALRRQVDRSQKEFSLRMSNIGKPLCQLQNESKGSHKARREYNHFIRMLIGDAVESIVRLVARAAEINITAESEKVNLQVNETVIPGTDDIEIDNEIYDVKSSSPYAFMHKWRDGWEGVYYHDSFGYVDQLYGYSKARGKPMGGWIVVDKSSGEVKVVHAKATPSQLDEIERRIAKTEAAIRENAPFEKCFEEEPELFKKKLTGNMKVPIVCTFCDFIHTCWPDAVQKPQAFSTASDKKMVWYSKEPIEGM